MEVRDDGVAVVTISNPPVNALSFDGIPTVLRAHKSPLALSFSWRWRAAAAGFDPDHRMARFRPTRSCVGPVGE
jgi:hypothetical protein